VGSRIEYKWPHKERIDARLTRKPGGIKMGQLGEGFRLLGDGFHSAAFIRQGPHLLALF
jgi:hypothetical protein